MTRSLSFSASRTLAGAAAALLLGVTLTGCSVLSSILPADKPTRDDAGEVIAEGRESAFDLKVGDCVIDTEGDTVSSLPVLPCTEQHADEVFFAFDLKAGPFPGEDAIMEAANTTCVAAFADYVGIPYEESELTYWPMTPSEGGWDAQGDREVLCMVYDESGELSVSVKGAQR